MGGRREISILTLVALLAATHFAKQLFLGASAQEMVTKETATQTCEARKCDILTIAMVNSPTPAAQYHNIRILLKRSQPTKDTLYDAYCMMQALDRSIGAESWALLFESGFEFGEYCCFPCALAFNTTIQDKILESIKLSEAAAAAAATEKNETEPTATDGQSASTKAKMVDDMAEMRDVKPRLQGSENARATQKKRKPHRKAAVKKPVQIIDEEDDEDIE